MRMRDIIDLVEASDETHARLDGIWAEIEAKAAELKAQQAAGEKASPGRAPKPKGFKSGRFADFYDQVVAAGAGMLGFERSDFPLDDVKEWIVHHRGLFKKGTVRIYRTMRVDTFWLNALKPGDEVGQHWTWELDPGQFVQFNMDMDSLSATDNIVTIAADVATSEVNFPMSVAYNVTFPNERELYLSGHARPVIASIKAYMIEDRAFDDEELRPDLIGKELTV